MDESERRQIIEAVARGELTPQEAAERFEEAETRSVAAQLPPPPPRSGGVSAVRILSDFGDVRVFGDASVAGAVANGPHEATEEGSTLVIRTRWVDGGGWVFRDRHSRIKVGDGQEERVDVRMNPRLPLDLRVRAGQVRIEGVEGPIKGEVQAGEVRIDGFRMPIGIDVAAGEVRARGRLDQGESYIRCKAGHVRLDLERGSSVRVRARATLGQVDLDEESHFAIAGRAQERVIGGGAGTLDIQSAVGQVEVRTDA
jgi:hypothetical protein